MIGMITGKISDSGSPIIETRVIGSRREIVIEGILDTGFDGYLCLSAVRKAKQQKKCSQVVNVNFEASAYW